MATRLLALVLAILWLQVAPATAQEVESTSTTLTAVPDQDIVPEPNAGDEPQEPGDRGGALQLAVLGLVVVAIGGAVLVVVRQSRRARVSSS